MRIAFLSMAILCVMHSVVWAQSDSSAVADTVLRQSLPTIEQRSPAVNFDVVLSDASAEPGEKVSLTIKATIKKGWHINAINLPEDAIGVPTEIRVRGLLKLDEAFESSEQPEKHEDAGVTQYFHKDQVSWTRSFRVSKRGLKTVKGAITFQACNDKSCLPPKTLKFKLGSSSPPVKMAKVELTHKTIGEPITVNLEECSATRPKAKLSVSGMLFGSRTDQLTLKGTVNLPDGAVELYLPKGKFQLENTASLNTRFDNTATSVSIDQNNDGELKDYESYPSNLPIRIGDKMFQVSCIDAANRQLTMHQVEVPLSGTIVGRKCPPFEYVSLDGNTISDKSIVGKVTLLDVWAVT